MVLSCTRNTTGVVNSKRLAIAQVWIAKRGGIKAGGQINGSGNQVTAGDSNYSHCEWGRRIVHRL